MSQVNLEVEKEDEEQYVSTQAMVVKEEPVKAKKEKKDPKNDDVMVIHIICVSTGSVLPLFLH